jgi:exodeoxyribonuclease-3
MKIATWNINGVKARIDTVLEWLKEASPDIACLQEIKSVDENFPRPNFEALGYQSWKRTDKRASTASRCSVRSRPRRRVSADCPAMKRRTGPVHRGTACSTSNGAVRVGCLYLPNGNPVDTEKFPTNCPGWSACIAHAEERLAEETPFLAWRLQRHSRSHRREKPGKLGRRRAVSAGSRRSVPGA